MHIIYSYTRQQALADGFQVDVTTTAREAGITFPVFLTRAVFEKFVAVPPGVTAQDEAGRLWDIVWMLRFAILRARGGAGSPSTPSRLPVALYVRNEPDACPVGCPSGYPSGARLIKFIATCGPLDLDDPSPAITVMLPDED